MLYPVLKFVEFSWYIFGSQSGRIYGSHNDITASDLFFHRLNVANIVGFSYYLHIYILTFNIIVKLLFIYCLSDRTIEISLQADTVYTHNCWSTTACLLIVSSICDLQTVNHIFGSQLRIQMLHDNTTIDLMVFLQRLNFAFISKLKNISEHSMV